VTQVETELKASKSCMFCFATITDASYNNDLQTL